MRAARRCCEPTTAQAADLAGLLKALADPARLRLVSLVAVHDGGEACVCDLTAPLGLTQPTISHHLKILVDAGIFTRDKRGVWAYYSQGLDSESRTLLKTVGSERSGAASLVETNGIVHPPCQVSLGPRHALDLHCAEHVLRQTGLSRSVRAAKPGR